MRLVERCPELQELHKKMVAVQQEQEKYDDLPARVYEFKNGFVSDQGQPVNYVKMRAAIKRGLYLQSKRVTNVIWSRCQVTAEKYVTKTAMSM